MNKKKLQEIYDELCKGEDEIKKNFKENLVSMEDMMNMVY